VSDTYVLCFCFVYLFLVYPKLSVSLDCPYLIAPSVFSNVYLIPKSSKLFVFPTIRLSAYLMEVVPKTRHAHYIKYLRY